MDSEDRIDAQGADEGVTDEAGMNDEPQSTGAAEPRPEDTDQSVPPRNEETAEPERAQEGWLDRLRTAVGFKANGSLRDSLASALAEETDDPEAFTPEERHLLRNILHLREIRVDDVMVPRADIESVDENIGLGDLLGTFRKAGHSRMPVYRETLDDPIGIVHIKDVMAFISEHAITMNGEGPGLDLRKVDLDMTLSDMDIVRPALFVPPSMPVADLMAKMQATRIQMALIIDEYGGTDGLASLEDLVETVVGDIEDEHDETDDPMIVKISEDVWVADARVALDDAEEAIGEDFALGDLGEDVDTLGGLVFSLTGRIPVRGELISSVELPGFEFEVLDADPRRIRRLRLYRRRASARVPRRRIEAGQTAAESAIS
ncbi:CBS domain containing-hemolysin-like protein [Amorphus orientalis]|uniref:CBS domain containing-hemolysin-like protein n=2 Tax=Amorphus orientalis TaxID=649198 RepID=A0AAE3VRX7_9HYPH|nr:hemolysin family protein [Amorphus orientalis]MDQ0317026.1 CBS domain containing-hemolysin-like protein [Amorphus orientalis]